MAENQAPPQFRPAGMTRENESKDVDRKENENHVRRKREMTKEEWLAQRERDIKSFEKEIMYSGYYYDEEHEYRHVTLPKEIAYYLPLGKGQRENRLLTEEEWRGLGVSQSLGWEHYMIYKPEPNILLFKRPINFMEEYLKKKAAKEGDEVTLQEKRDQSSDTKTTDTASTDDIGIAQDSPTTTKATGKELST